MNNTLFLILFGILTLTNAIILFYTRRNRKHIMEAQELIIQDITQASDLMDGFYKKLDEFQNGLEEIADKN